MIGYVIVLALLSYCLWRIQAIEAKIDVNDNLDNLTGNTDDHQRITRSIKDQMLLNSFGDEKGLTSHPAWKKPTNKSEFDELVNDLFDKIKTMHNDPDRGHFDRNMKAVFQSWFPVFDALLPRDLKEDTEFIRNTRDASPKKEYVYQPNKDDSKSSEESSDESDKMMHGRKKDDSASSDESDVKKNKKSKQ